MLRGFAQMKLHRVKAVILRQLYELRRNPSHLTNMVYWPVMNIAVWGFFTLYLARRGSAQPAMVSSLLGAVILWGLFNAFQRDMAVGFLEELWSKNLVNLFGSPLSVFEYVTGLIAVNLFKAIVAMAVESAIAWLCYRFNIFPMLLAFVPFILNLVLFGLAVGVAVTGLILRYTTRFQVVAWSFAGLLMPFSCVFYPLKSLPIAARPFAWILPTTHSFEGMRQAIAGQGFSIAHFEWGLILDAVYFLLAILFFRWMFESARSLGLLVKME
jgi:ABC-2 type transport system permease protein